MITGNETVVKGLFARPSLRGRISLFSHTQYLGDLERGHSCPPLRPGQRPSGQECPRSEKNEMRTYFAVGDPNLYWSRMGCPRSENRSYTRPAPSSRANCAAGSASTWSRVLKAPSPR